MELIRIVSNIGRKATCLYLFIKRGQNSLETKDFESLKVILSTI